LQLLSSVVYLYKYSCWW